MKILSPFIDYYDNVFYKNKSYIYKRKSSFEHDIYMKYRTPLLRASIGFQMSNTSDIHLCQYVNETSRLSSVTVTPMVVGIAGNLYYFVEYTNTMLNIEKKCFSYEELKPFFKNNFIATGFRLSQEGLLNKYCYKQFGCVNFIVWENDNTVNLIKEPNLKNAGLDVLIPAETCYNNIDLFLKDKVVNNKIYKAIKKTEWEKQLEKK